MKKTTGKKPKTVLGTIGTLLLALLIYFLQGGKGGSGSSESTPKATVPQAKPAPTVVEQTPVVEPKRIEEQQLGDNKQVNDSVSPSKAIHRSYWHQSNLQRHWEKHRAEFPECHSAEEYGKATMQFVDNPPEGTLTKTSADGDQLFYHPPSNRFVAVTADGAIKTCFKPDQGIRYWNRQ
ncbi:MAG: hypothetical protein IKO65_00870 [Victivallales bacterium]|nr:hypothetical protein [Victivallales bacterium]